MLTGQSAFPGQGGLARFKSVSETERIVRKQTFTKTSQRRQCLAVQLLSLMHKTNSIIMHAPRMSIFETAANLELWPKILPHYRYIHFLERSPNRNVVVMAARRSGIPIKWTSEKIIDREKIEVRFHHLKAFSKGMD